jgi:hypothetical protein
MGLGTMVGTFIGRSRGATAGVERVAWEKGQEVVHGLLYVCSEYAFISVYWYEGCRRKVRYAVVDGQAVVILRTVSAMYYAARG